MKQKKTAFSTEDLVTALDKAIAFAKDKTALRTTVLPPPPKKEFPKPTRIIRAYRRMNAPQLVQE